MSSTVTTPDPDPSIEEEKLLGVTFVPELYLQRQAWVLEVLRNQKVTSVGNSRHSVFLALIYWY